MINGFTGFFSAIKPVQYDQRSFALILNAPTEVNVALADIRRRFDPAMCVGIPAHITVKRPAMIGMKFQPEDLLSELKYNLRDFSPLEVELDGWDSFKAPERNVVFLNVVQPAPFKQLHQRILQVLKPYQPDGFADSFEGANYHPHVTVGNELSSAAHAVLDWELNSLPQPLRFNFTLDKLGLYVKEGEQAWEEVGIINLPANPIYFPFSNAFSNNFVAAAGL